MNKQFRTNRRTSGTILILIAIILIFAFYAHAQVCTPAPAGLISLYRAESNLLDARGGNNATSPANPMTYAQGMVGQAFSIPGLSSSNRWDVPDNPNLNPQTLTIEAWIKTPGNGGNAGFIASKSGLDAGSGFEFFFGYPAEGNHLRFDLNGGSGGADLTGNINITDNLFHHVAATYDGATMKLYVDGVLDVQKAVTTAISYTAGRPFVIDRREYPDAFPANMPGIIDELSFYNRALSLAEIQAIHNADTAGKCNLPATAPVGLVSWYSGDGNALDSRSRNDGTLQNGTTFAAGLVGQGFSFDGADDSLQINNGFMSASAFTFDFWLNIDSFTDPDYMSPFCQAAPVFPPGPGNQLCFFTGNDLGSFGFHGDWQNGGGYDLRSNIPFGTGVWKHIAVTYDGTTLKQYVDGEVQNQAAHPNKLLGNNFPLLIGKGYAYPSALRTAYFDGSVDEVEIFDRALSQTEIQAIVNAGALGKLKPTATVAPSGLVGFWAGDGAPTIFRTEHRHNSQRRRVCYWKVAQFSTTVLMMSKHYKHNLTWFGTGDFSIEFWANLDSLANDQTLFHKVSGTGSSQTILRILSSLMLKCSSISPRRNLERQRSGVKHRFRLAMVSGYGCPKAMKMPIP